MTLSRYLKPECVSIIDPPADKDQLLRKIATLSSNTAELSAIHEEDIYRKLKKREEQGSTAFGSGIAVPHCSFKGLESFVMGLLILKGKGTSFDAPDNTPVNLCFFIIGPEEARNEHIQILSGITRLLNTTEAAHQLRQARWPDDAFSILVGSVELGRAASAQVPASQMSVAIQDDSVFIDILELFTAEPDCHIAVFEGTSAGRYLHHLPLFSSFWTDEQNTEVKLIQAVLKTSACNNMIRRINTIRDTSQPDSGVLISVNELSYWCGGLSY
jgi:PTS system nitrogen regulatory IIA component